MMHGVELLLPFNIIKAMFLLSDITFHFFSTDLLAICGRQLTKQDEDLAEAHAKLLKSCFTSVCNCESHFANTIHNYDFKQGDLIIVLNKKVEPASNAKCKARYFRPMVVILHSCNGLYSLAEVNGAISKLKHTVFCLIPYHACSPMSLDVTRFIDKKDLTGVASKDEQAVWKNQLGQLNSLVRGECNKSYHLSVGQPSEL